MAGIFALVTGLAAPAHASASPLLPVTAIDAPTVHGRAAYLLDASSGEVLFEDNSAERMPIASLTKTMTAYVVLKTAKPTDVVEIAPADVAYAEDGGGTTADLRAGDRLTVDELLYGVMLPSGADAAHALARTYGPGVGGFVAKMNATARELGMTDTRYVNADGLPMPGGDGYSTARDQALLAAKALELPMIRETAGTRYHSLDATDEHRSYSWRNTNRLLRTTPDAIGLKTGFTRAAGFCLAFASEQDGRRLVGVLLGESDSSRRFATAEELLTWGASRQSA
ncbi:D-alanyl-D-alanine carboxypeptidase family protein [Nonomuraea turcica]|uniref:D-alanyl-D-alanine carboxypeptidase family protein n=1 Tax=Nonomuraea sp. G32 TaxID=3067274 RepID=UPI00273C605E|nr:D-alanyl-D-alanine carboxypeptidase family protein [Nonomuraea sp. G32]MDP4509979.1 D-alanyl-D-alanine carboxypeptidase family protein [Nonomuraea sp. G32]